MAEIQFRNNKGQNSENSQDPVPERQKSCFEKNQSSKSETEKTSSEKEQSSMFKTAEIKF